VAVRCGASSSYRLGRRRPTPGCTHVPLRHGSRACSALVDTVVVVKPLHLAGLVGSGSGVRRFRWQNAIADGRRAPTPPLRVTCSLCSGWPPGPGQTAGQGPGRRGVDRDDHVAAEVTDLLLRPDVAFRAMSDDTARHQINHAQVERDRQARENVEETNLAAPAIPRIQRTMEFMDLARPATCSSRRPAGSFRACGITNRATPNARSCTRTFHEFGHAVLSREGRRHRAGRRRRRASPTPPRSKVPDSANPMVNT